MAAAPQRSREATSREVAKIRLIELIDSGEITPDAPLSERALAERMGISRTPVREALQDLAREGIITVHPARGAYLNAISFDEMRDLYEVRLSLEGVAAYRAAASGDHSALLPLVEQFNALRHRPKTPEILHQAQELGDRFHLEMFKATGNRYLLLLYERLHLKIRISLRMTREHRPQRVAQTIDEHLTVLQAILERSPLDAQQAIDTHLRNGFEARMKIFAELPRLRISSVVDDPSPAPSGDTPAHDER